MTVSVFVNFGDPARAEALAALPVDGAGPCPIETILREGIGVHPMALLHPERVADAATLARLEERAAGFASRTHLFVEGLASGMAAFARPFAPRPVVVRLSDFSTAEWGALEGGAGFEPVERNPLVGFRGAVRYVHPHYAEAFALECAAVARARGALGCANLIPMVPYCRRVAEAEAVLAAMAAHGLERGRDGLRIYLMAEVPSNVFAIDAFAALFDGVSIGSRDLAQLVLGIDGEAAFADDVQLDETDPAFLAAVSEIVAGARRQRVHVSICGAGPSRHPALVEHVVRCGIDAVSLRPDAVATMVPRIRGAE
ncbi:MAG: putative PEP-binding protein [Acetobacterales bacterium]